MNNVLLRREAGREQQFWGYVVPGFPSPGNLWVQSPRGGGRVTVLPASSFGGNVGELL